VCGGRSTLPVGARRGRKRSPTKGTYPPGPPVGMNLALLATEDTNLATMATWLMA
jgi:hypothetical protein